MESSEARRPGNIKTAVRREVSEMDEDTRRGGEVGEGSKTGHRDAAGDLVAQLARFGAQIHNRNRRDLRRGLPSQTYALKEFPDDSSQRQQISGQVQILKKLDHPNLVRCYDVIFGNAGVSFLLLKPLDSGSSNVTSESDLVTYAYQLLLGSTFLHRNKIWHGDITPSNIFVDHTGQVKLLYLGKTLSKAPPFSAEIGALHDRFSWDIWSVGLYILKLSRDLGSSEDVPAAELKQKQPPHLDLSLSYMNTSHSNEGTVDGAVEFSLSLHADRYTQEMDGRTTCLPSLL